MNTKVRKDYIEADYINGVKNSKGETVIRALTEEEKAWLNDFYGEFINANVKREGGIIDWEDRKEIYNANNSRNRCIYNQKKIRGMLIDLDVDEYDKFLGKLIDQSGISYEECYIDSLEAYNAHFNEASEDSDDCYEDAEDFDDSSEE